MADNTVLNPGSGGDTIVTEQPGGVGAKIPVSKIYTGALDVNGGPVTAANPFDVRDTVITKRFGVVSLGAPSGVISVAGPTTLYTPTAGMKVRLKWIHLAGSQNNSAEVVATIKLGTVTVYIVPLSNPGVFSHASLREAVNANDLLTITLSPAGQNVYANFDVEEF